jgi:hypothetical protein
MKCRVFVHPVFSCSHTTVAKDLLCGSCHNLLSLSGNPKNLVEEKDETTKLKEAPMQDDDKLSENDSEHENKETDVPTTTEKEDKSSETKKKKKRRSRQGKGSVPTRISPRKKQKTEVGIGTKDKDDWKAVSKELFASPAKKQKTSPPNAERTTRKQ